MENKIDNRTIIINARGIKYEILLHSLDKYPNTRLGKLKKLIIKQNSIDIGLLCDKFNHELTECYFNESRLKLSADVEDIIEKELKSFDLQKYRDYGQASHRLFAFFHAIAAARPSIPTWAKS